MKIIKFRDHISFFIFPVILIALIFFGIFITLNKSLFIDRSNEELISIFKNFQQNHRPLVELNFGALFKKNRLFQELPPILDFQHLEYGKESRTCRPDSDLLYLILSHLTESELK